MINSTLITAVIRGGRVETDSPLDLPEGTEVMISVRERNQGSPEQLVSECDSVSVAEQRFAEYLAPSFTKRLTDHMREAAIAAIKTRERNPNEPS